MHRIDRILLGLFALSLTALASFGCPSAAQPPPSASATAPAPPSAPAASQSSCGAWQDLTPAEIEARKRALPPEVWQVTQEQGTEAPFRNAYWDHHEPGIYVDVVSGEPLFSSTDKFESGSGWPSFTRPIDSARVVSREDTTLGMSRTEVRSGKANSHLGHLFEDGPQPTGQRYCIDSAALRFIPARRLVAEGYAEFSRLFPSVAQDLTR